MFLILCLSPLIITFIISRTRIIVNDNNVTYKTLLKKTTISRSEIRKAKYSVEMHYRGYTPVYEVYTSNLKKASMKIAIKVFSLDDAKELAQILKIKNFNIGEKAKTIRPKRKSKKKRAKLVTKIILILYLVIWATTIIVACLRHIRFDATFPLIISNFILLLICMAASLFIKDAIKSIKTNFNIRKIVPVIILLVIGSFLLFNSIKWTFTILTGNFSVTTGTVTYMHYISTSKDPHYEADINGVTFNVPNSFHNGDVVKIFYIPGDNKVATYSVLSETEGNSNNETGSK